jgi:uroporphyrinogen-III synthase
MENKKVAIYATRKADEVANKVFELGFEPFIEDVIKIQKLPEDIIVENIKMALDKKPEVFYFTTGEGVNIIFQKAKESNLYEKLKDFMESGKVFVRGYKARSVLLKEGFKDFINLESTDEFIEKLKNADLTNLNFFVQMYGEKLPDLDAFLLSKGASMIEVWVYKYQIDTNKMDAFIEKLIEGFYGAVLFTSAYQVDYLFKRAEEIFKKAKLVEALNQIVVITVGHITAKKLTKYGVYKVFYPERERLTFALKILEKVFNDG